MKKHFPVLVLAIDVIAFLYFLSVALGDGTNSQWLLAIVFLCICLLNIVNIFYPFISLEPDSTKGKVSTKFDPQ